MTTIKLKTVTKFRKGMRIVRAGETERIGAVTSLYHGGYAAEIRFDDGGITDGADCQDYRVATENLRQRMVD